MNEEKEDPILAAPNLVKEESTTSIPMDTINGESVSNNVDSSSDEKEKKCPTYDERRISLLNNPSYGVILCFLDKFRTNVDIQDYPLHLLEENLLSDQENISRRLIDFHLTLLKRISLGKGAHRDKFVPIITKFAYRFDYEDGEYLKTNGYSQAEIDIKLRILKNLLETQFDHNQGFKTALLEKQSFEVRSQAFGRDRSGASYWLFLDSECFIRLFRENIDDDRTWTNIAKDKDELENIIRILITDNIVRKKFPDWKFTHEPFESLEPSNEFEERFIPTSINVKKEEQEIKQPSPSLSPAAPVKIEKKLVKNRKKRLPSPIVKNEIQSDHESTNSGDKNGERSRIVSSEDTNPNTLPQEINNNQEDKKLARSATKSRGRRKSATWNKKKRRTVSNTSKKDEHEQEVKTPTKGRKRKQIIHDDDEEAQDIKKNEETSHNKDKNIDPIPMDDESNNNNDLTMGLRRSTRIRKAPTSELPSLTSSPAKSVAQTPTKKKLTNGKCKPSSQTNVKVSSQSSKTNGRRKRKRRAGKTSMNGASSSEDEHQPSEEEEDEYNSDDYLPDNKQLDDLDEEDLVEEDADDEFVPRRSAKTVAKRRGQLSENNTEDLQAPSSACCFCSKTDRPESLLLCDDCDDAYHLECLKPALLAVPDGDWYCPLCEHKRLSNNLIEKLIQLIREHEELEVKRNQCMSKRTNRLANVTLNLDRMVKRSSKKGRPNGFVYSDEEKDDDEEDNADENNKSDEEEEDDEDDDSVYGFKDDGSIDGGEKPKRSSASPRGRRDGEEPERLGVRSCRRKPQNYRFDDYDKKLKQAMIEAGENADEIDKDSDNSDVEHKKKSPKKHATYEKDEDFDAPDAKNDAEFAPDEKDSGESGSEEEEDYDDDDDESSDDGGGWKSKRRSSPKKKSSSKSNRRKSKNQSDDDESLSDAELNSFQTADTTKSDTMNDMDYDDRRRSSRATTQKSYAKQDGNSDDDDEEDLLEDGRPPPRRMRYKRRRGSDDSFVEDDDYDKLARKRKIVKYGKAMSRSSITDHLKKLVDEDDESTEDKPPSSPSKANMQEVSDDVANEQHKIPPAKLDEPQPSDDDDFPDEQEIFKANGLLKLQKTLGAPKPAGFRPPFMAPTHSYQHAIIDPTARFAMIRPPVRPAMTNGYPSNGHNIGESQQPSDETNQVNGHNSPTS